MPSPQQRLSPVQSASSAYVLQAGKLIKQALAYEGSGEYEEAFDLFKAGVDVLLNGVQSELLAVFGCVQGFSWVYFLEWREAI